MKPRLARAPSIWELRFILWVFALAAVLAVAANKVLDIFRLAWGDL